VELPLQITWRNLDKSPAVEEDIRTRADKLNEFHDRIVSCRVVVEASHRSHHKGNLFRVRIDVKVPERELVVTRDPGDEHEHEDLYVTVRDAFDAMNRQLKEAASAQNGRRRASST
jgi:ribosomal subunit interface protein